MKLLKNCCKKNKNYKKRHTSAKNVKLIKKRTEHIFILPQLLSTFIYKYFNINTFKWRKKCCSKTLFCFVN